LPNNRLWGTLSADIVVHPKSLKDPRVAEALERAIGRLRNGAVTVNSWSGFVLSFASPPWGAYPGSTPADIQSGNSWVHNTPMLEGIEKTVLRHPLTIKPRPAVFLSHRTAHMVMERITTLEERASWSKVPGGSSRQLARLSPQSDFRYSTRSAFCSAVRPRPFFVS
jgi:aldehyde dehydrogenase (NAD(P)+)